MSLLYALFHFIVLFTKVSFFLLTVINYVLLNKKLQFKKNQIAFCNDVIRFRYES